jgi:hypothetical protein
MDCIGNCLQGILNGRHWNSRSIGPTELLLREGKVFMVSSDAVGGRDRRESLNRVR